MDDAELVKFNHMGLIPGPHENEEAFSNRVKFCLELKTLLKEDQLPKRAIACDLSMLSSACALSEQIFGIQPLWIPLFFSNWKLLPWHGGAAWIFQLEENGPLGVLLQLRKSFYHQSRYLGMYDRDALIAHELAHAGRMAFEEPKYEELLAYRAIKKGLSAKFGAILQSSFESKLFVYSLVILLLLDLFALLMGSLEGFLTLLPLKGLLLILILWGLYRLQSRKRTLSKTERALEMVFGDQAPHVLYRLTDAEIDFFAKTTPQELAVYIAEEHSFRWLMIKKSYSKLE